MITDVVVDTLFDEQVEDALKTLGGRIVRNPDGEPWLTEDGFLVVRTRTDDPSMFARALQRQAALRIVAVTPRT